MKITREQAQESNEITFSAWFDPQCHEQNSIYLGHFTTYKEARHPGHIPPPNYELRVEAQWGLLPLELHELKNFRAEMIQSGAYPSEWSSGVDT